MSSLKNCCYLLFSSFSSWAILSFKQISLFLVLTFSISILWKYYLLLVWKSTVFYFDRLVCPYGRGCDWAQVLCLREDSTDFQVGSRGLTGYFCSCWLKSFESRPACCRLWPNWFCSYTQVNLCNLDFSLYCFSRWSLFILNCFLCSFLPIRLISLATYFCSETDYHSFAAISFGFLKQAALN